MNLTSEWRIFFGTERCRLGGAIMKRFFFDLVGDIRAHDFMGHECSSKKEAKKQASKLRRSVPMRCAMSGTNNFDRPACLTNLLLGTSSPCATNVAQRYSLWRPFFSRRRRRSARV